MVRGFRRGVGAVFVIAAFALLPASAQAKDAISVYPPDADSSQFSASPGSYTAFDQSDGLCIAPLTCPSIDNTWEASGGTRGDGDGYLSTSIFGIADAAGESRAIWTSGPFQYNGAGGQRPTDLGVTVSHQSSLSALLSVAGNQADYSVELIKNGGAADAVITNASLAPTVDWTREVVELGRDSLSKGAMYQFRVVSRFIYDVGVLETGSADYDDIVLVAVREEDGDGNGNGNGRGRCEDLFPGAACFDGRRLFIKLKCFGVKNKKGKCHSRATAVKTKSGKPRYTFPIQRVVKAKKGKVIRARVRFRFREELEKRKSIILKSVLRKDSKDKKKVVKHKKLKLIDRSPD